MHYGTVLQCAMPACHGHGHEMGMSTCNVSVLQPGLKRLTKCSPLFAEPSAARCLLPGVLAEVKLLIINWVCTHFTAICPLVQVVHEKRRC